MLDWVVRACVVLLGTATCLPKRLHHLVFPPAMNESFYCFAPSPALGAVSVLGSNSVWGLYSLIAILRTGKWPRKDERTRDCFCVEVMRKCVKIIKRLYAKYKYK